MKMKTKFFSCLIVIGGVVYCSQSSEKDPVGIGDADLSQAMLPQPLLFDRSTLSQEILPSDFLGSVRSGGSANSAKLINASLHNFNEAAAENSVSVEGPERSQPSAYDQRLADQKAWGSQRRAAQLGAVTGGRLESFGEVAKVAANARANRAGDFANSDQPIVPGVKDPHHWYELDQATEVVRILPPLLDAVPVEPEVEIAFGETPAKAELVPEEWSMMGLAAGQVALAPSWEGAQAVQESPVPLRIESNDGLATTAALPTLTPRPTHEPAPVRVAQRWETGRY